MDRPYTLINVAISADGKISTASRGRVRFSSDADRELMDELRAQADAILLGAQTIRAEDPPVRVRSRARREARRAAGKPAHPLTIVVSRSLDLPLGGRYFSDRRTAKLVVTTEDAPPELVERVNAYAEVIRVGRGTVDARRLAVLLKTRGIDRLLVEGGGEINFTFLRAGLVDELYLTVCPVIIGGRTAPTPVDGPGFDPSEFPALRLLDVRQHGDEVFLHYQVVGDQWSVVG